MCKYQWTLYSEFIKWKKTLKLKKDTKERRRSYVVANIIIISRHWLYMYWYEWYQLLILEQISGLSLIALGAILLTDTKLTGQEVKGLFVFIYILGVNFRNIIDGFGIAMIVLGSIAFVLNSLAIISDVILQSKTKSKLVRNALI